MARSTTNAKVRAVEDENMEAAADSEAPIKMEAPAPAVLAPAAAAEKPKRKGFIRRLILPVIVLAAIGGGAWYGHEWWINGRFMVSTDDGYVEGDISSIAP